MNSQQIDSFKVILNQRLDDLLRHAVHTVSEILSQDMQEIEYFDRVSADLNQNFKLRIRSRESALIKKIRQALERIENQSYGICESCGEDISLKRLEARPVTTKCIYCKEEEERLEKLELLMN